MGVVADSTLYTCCPTTYHLMLAFRQKASTKHGHDVSRPAPLGPGFRGYRGSHMHVYSITANLVVGC